MRLGVLAASVARVIEHRRRRRSAAKREIVAHVNPTSPGISLALGEDRYGGVVAVQSIGCEDMRFNAPEERFQHRTAGPPLGGQGRQAQRHPFPRVAFGLAIERADAARTSRTGSSPEDWDRPSLWRSHG